MGIDCGSPQEKLNPGENKLKKGVTIWGAKFDRDTRVVMAILHASDIEFQLLEKQDE